MGLMDTIRKTEERSRAAARRGMQIARSGWEDTERALRRRMRIYPESKNKKTAGRSSGAPSQAAVKDDVVHDVLSRQDDQGASPAAKRPAIVSVNGKDLGPEERPPDRRIA
jgi:hypothetical protein